MNTRLGAIALSLPLLAASCTSTLKYDDPDKVETVTIDFGSTDLKKLAASMVVALILFASAYNAESVRGGLQAIPGGQKEAANALGLTYWQAQRLVILPQALKIAIPSIVNNFISLYKNTTLVLIIGMLDPLGIGRAALADAQWTGLAREVYLFVALFFFLCCFAMSRYSLYLERKLHTGH